MPNWSQLVKEIGQLGSPFDILRRKYINEPAAYKGRNVICYYSGWLQKPELGTAVGVNATNGVKPERGRTKRTYRYPDERLIGRFPYGP